MCSSRRCGVADGIPPPRGFYANEKENGEGLRQSGVKREDVFICTKVRQGDLMPDAFAKVLEQSLANLKLPQVEVA